MEQKQGQQGSGRRTVNRGGRTENRGWSKREGTRENSRRGGRKGTERELGREKSWRVTTEMRRTARGNS